MCVPVRCLSGQFGLCWRVFRAEEKERREAGGRQGKRGLIYSERRTPRLLLAVHARMYDVVRFELWT